MEGFQQVQHQNKEWECGQVRWQWGHSQGEEELPDGGIGVAQMTHTYRVLKCTSLSQTKKQQKLLIIKAFSAFHHTCA